MLLAVAAVIPALMLPSSVALTCAPRARIARLLLPPAGDSAALDITSFSTLVTMMLSVMKMTEDDSTLASQQLLLGMGGEEEVCVWTPFGFICGPRSSRVPTLPKRLLGMGHEAEVCVLTNEGFICGPHSVSTGRDYEQWAEASVAWASE